MNKQLTAAKTWGWLGMNDWQYPVPAPVMRLVTKTTSRLLDFKGEIAVCDQCVAIKVAPGAKLELVQFWHQLTGVQKIKLTLQTDSECQLTNLFWHCQAAHSRIEIVLAGEGARVTVRDVYAVGSRETLLLDREITHLSERTISEIAVAGTLGEQSFKKSRLIADLQPGATSSQARISEKTTLLGEPQENKCLPAVLSGELTACGQHGAAVGRVDKQARRWAAARGVAAATLERLLEREQLLAAARRLGDDDLRDQVLAIIRKEWGDDEN